MNTELSLHNFLDCGLDEDIARPTLLAVRAILNQYSPSKAWGTITDKVLKPEHPFKFHQLLYTLSYQHWNHRQGFPPLWIPDLRQISLTHLSELMKEMQISTYKALYLWSIRDREQFWETMMHRLGIQFQHPYRNILDLSDGVEIPHWCFNAQLNIIESCFQAPEQVTAIVSQGLNGPLKYWSYGDLKLLVSRVANGLHDMKVRLGDAIAVILPMTAESIAVYLGIIAAGGIVVPIADSFSAEEIETRLRIAPVKALFTQDYIHRGGQIIPLYEKVIKANPPQIVVQLSAVTAIHLRPGDQEWENFLSHNDKFRPVYTHPETWITLLFSSGTTGVPKAIPWTQTTPIKSASDAYLHHDIRAGDVFAWPTNLGWMMGPWLVFASLINQATIALYEDTPTGRPFGQFIQDAGVTLLGVVPSLVRCWRNSQCMRGLNWNKIKAFSSTGECSNPEDMLYLSSLAGYQPIIEYCGGTEIGGGYLTSTLVQPNAPSTFTTPAMGTEIAILNEQGQPSYRGELFLIPPSIGLSTELLNQNHHQVYFANTPSLHPEAGSIESYPLYQTLLRRHGDQIEQFPNQTYRVLGRIDDTLNLSGIKVSTAEIERVLNEIPDIQETAAIAISPGNGPSQIVIYTVIHSQSSIEASLLLQHCQQQIKQRLNPLFKVHDLVIVDQLPRTASNKVMRRRLRDRYQQTSTPARQP